MMQMDTLQRHFLESPFYVLLVVGFAAAVLFGLWYTRRKRKWVVGFGIAVAVGAVVWGVSAAVVTQREKLDRTAHRMAELFRTGQYDQLQEHISDNYSGFGESKTTLMQLVRSEGQRWTVEKISLRDMEIDVSGRFAEMRVTSVIHMPQGVHALRWTVDWVLLKDGWKVERVSDYDRVVPGFSGQ
jgi:hypothetical protein